MSRIRTASFLIVIPLIFGLTASTPLENDETDILFHTINPSEGHLRMYYCGDDGEQFNSFRNLKEDLESQGKKLSFAMNGGMYMEDRRPLGLYIEKGEELRPLNTRKKGHGNFYLHPNGVFMLHNDGTAEVCPTYEYEQNGTVGYATQSGPMLLVDGDIHPTLTKGSSNVHIRNGVGILPDGKVLFAMSREIINFYDFATFFKEQGCQNALYLDGFVSRTYLPSQDIDYLGGNFGVIIAESR